MEPIDPADLRISDADRHRIAEVLREAAGEGRIDLDELDERLEATWRAKTYRDLVPLTIDLGAPPAVPPVGAAPAPTGQRSPARRTPAGVMPTHDGSLAMLGECKRVGVWDIGVAHTAVAVMGGVVIDLREARFPAGGEVEIIANAVMGGVEVLVDAHTVVHVSGVGVMGSFREVRTKVAAETDASSPVVRVRGLALMGAVEVKRKRPPGERRRLLPGG